MRWRSKTLWFLVATHTVMGTALMLSVVHIRCLENEIEGLNDSIVVVETETRMFISLARFYNYIPCDITRGGLRCYHGRAAAREA